MDWFNANGTGRAWIQVGATRDDPVERLLHVPCQKTDTLAVLRTKMANVCRRRNDPKFVGRNFDWVEWLEWTRDKNFEVRGCTLPEEVTLEMLGLKTGEHLRFMDASKDCRAAGESMERSVQRLFDLQKYYTTLPEREAKGNLFNQFITRTLSELSMSDSAFAAIKRALAGQRGLIKNYEVVQLVLDASSDYLSPEQSSELVKLMESDNFAFPDHITLSVWLHWIGQTSRDCGQGGHHRVFTKPAPDVLGTPAFPQTYYGLDWDKTYTYPEARPLVAKYVINAMASNLHQLMQFLAPRRGTHDERLFAQQTQATLHKRAVVRSEAMRGWSKLIKLAPLIGRWSLFFKSWYNEVSLRPGIGSVWSESRDRFAGMQAEQPKRDVRQRVE